MPNAIRALVDLSFGPQLGHPHAPTFPSQPQNRTVYINNLPAIVVGDQYEQSIHVNPKGQSHPTFAGEGSPDVFVEGLPVHRTFDSMTCGDTAGVGSSDVFIDGV